MKTRVTAIPSNDKLTEAKNFPQLLLAAEWFFERKDLRRPLEKPEELGAVDFRS